MIWKNEIFVISVYRNLKVSSVIAFNVLQNICIFQWVRGLKSITYDGRRVKRKRAKSASLPALPSQNLPLNISSGPTNKLQGLFFRWRNKISKFCSSTFCNYSKGWLRVSLPRGCASISIKFKRNDEWWSPRCTFPFKKRSEKSLQKRRKNDLATALSIKKLRFKMIRNDDLPAALSIKSSPHGEIFLHLFNNSACWDRWENKIWDFEWSTFLLFLW